MSEFKVGDLVACITDKYSHVTKGKVYEVIAITPNKSRIEVMNKAGVVYQYPVEMFKLVQEANTETWPVQSEIPDCGCPFIGGMHNVDCRTNDSEKMALDKQITEAMRKRREVPDYLTDSDRRD